ncbi:choice-of-anchor M domain-containing protein, partial [Verrucomicrobia bacterium]|nr:choice-of-anchor M domain-containing protein [Verrucomicrobiota bacterium]
MNKNILIKLSLLLLVVASKNNINAQEHEKWIIGHGDLTADYVGYEWVFSFHHEDEAHDQTLVLDQNSRNTVPDIERFNFLGKAGNPVWIIPQINTEGVPFMGFNSHLTPIEIFEQDSFNVHLTTVRAPGDFFIWTSSIDGIDISYNSSDGLGALDVMKFPARGHFHKNLGFNSPGTYNLGFTASGVLADGGLTTKSEEYFVKYEVNVLSEGEVDLEIVYEDGKLGAEILAALHDDHGDHHQDGVEYPVNEVALRVKTKSATLVPNDPAYGFLGNPGDLVYELPQHEEKGLLFLGIGADELEKGVFVNDQVQVNLKSVEGPGNIYLYEPNLFGPPNVIFNSADGITESDKFLANVGGHAHQSMAF